MALSKYLMTAFALASVIPWTKAESHMVVFINKCGFGTPLLKANGQTLSTGGSFTSNGPLTDAIAFLQTGNCGDNGENCTLVETTLMNPTTSSPGIGSSSDINLIPPHSFSGPIGFAYFNGCDGVGANCTNPNCSTALHNPNDTQRQVVCLADNVNLAINFCD